MNITLRQLEVFLAVASTQSTTKGADKIALSQSAVSSALSELENQLNVQLFERIGKRLILNENARMLLPKAQALLEQAQELEVLFQQGHGTLRIGASTTIGNYLLPQIIARYQQRYPALTLELRVANSAEIAADVANLNVDIGFIEGTSHRLEIDSQIWRTDSMAIFCSPRHPLANKTVTADQLAKSTWILREPGSGTREVVEQHLLPHIHHFNVLMELGNSEAIKHAIHYSQAISCLSIAVIADQLESGRLALIHLNRIPLIQRPLYLIRHKQKHISKNLSMFLAECKITQQVIPTPE